MVSRNLAFSFKGATGGMAELIKPYTKTFDEIDTELTLTGLQLIYGLNCQGKDA